MKSIKITLFFLYGLFVSILLGCNSQDELSQAKKCQVLPEGTSFQVDLGAYADGMSMCELKSNGDNPDQITDLRLLVFDENHQFLYSRKAILGGNSTSPMDNQSYLPDMKRDYISVVKNFSVNVISSSKKRYIHFIANHDWTGFPQDYFLEGKDEGQLIGGMISSKLEFWRKVEFSSLQPIQFNNKVVKLLRNNARISVECVAPDFNYSGFTVYNAYDKASVAPFVFKEDLSYEFSLVPQLPTVPADVSKKSPMAFADYLNGIDVFERYNTDNSPMFVLFKGQHKGKRMGYYKVALKHFDEPTGISSLYDIVRNHHYKVKVSSVLNEGYATPEEAASKPAGNNLFASVEMANYPSVSDGSAVFSLSKLGGVYVSATSAYEAEVFYTHGINNVKAYPSWDTSNEYIQSWSMTPDPIDDKKGKLSVKFKKIPQDRTLLFDMNLVARPNLSNTDNIITRKVKLFLRPPYSFKPELVSHGRYTGNKVSLSFEVPQTIPSTAFPFEVYIETRELTPDLTQNDQMILEVKDQRYFYKYTVKDAPSIGNTVTLHFIRNNDDAFETINLMSDYYKDDKVTLGNYSMVQGQLKYGPVGGVQNVPYDGDIRYSYNNTGANSNISVQMLDGKGHYRIIVKDDIDKSKPFTLYYLRTVSNTYGKVTYDNEDTKTVQEWLDDPNRVLPRHSIKIEGLISFYSEYYGTYGTINDPSRLKIVPGTFNPNTDISYVDNTWSKYTFYIRTNALVEFIQFDYLDYYISSKSLLNLEYDGRVILRR
ncbi:hypothetical protein [Porphyromonas pogonae]|uniref:hypothetical protein n=1 Tax=Porphyromonas pogonae TaxID=867595 RepID=UPI002E798B66|nr:hypothetical protein [Porphyromonas pogonae]